MVAPVTISDLNDDVLGRIEESNPPVFWDLSGEVYVQMVNAMFEAALVTGVVQANAVSVTLPVGETYFSLQNNTAIGIPSGVVAVSRIRAPYQIRKTSLKALDDYDPAWQQYAASTQILSWFPLGTSHFGIVPQLSVETQVTMDFILSPVNESRPYTGTETIPFQDEFVDLVSQYAAALLRLKEGGAEAEESDVVFQAFLSRMKKLSIFQGRVDDLTYSSAFGAGGNLPNPRKIA